MNNAQLRRQTAIGMLMELYVPAANDYDLTSTDRNAIADNIAKLAIVGRTERWQRAVKQWAAMVRNSDGSERGVRHAFLQGAVYAGHASE